jgi:hypothetical protein
MPRFLKESLNHQGVEDPRPGVEEPAPATQIKTRNGPENLPDPQNRLKT